MRPAAALLPRKRLEFLVFLDMPVGLTPPEAGPAGPERAIVFTRAPDQGGQEPRADGTQPGWLVLLGIRNQGPAPIRGTDFGLPPAITFPGRQVLAAWLSAAPAAGRERRHGPWPTTRGPDGVAAAPYPGSGDPDQVRLTGNFLLRPQDAYTITVILSGTPMAGSRPVHPDGALASGRSISRPCQ